MKTSVIYCFLFYSVLATSITCAADSLRTVFIKGDAAPGTVSASFRGAGSPSINNNGQVAFLGILIGPDITTTNDWGIWSEKSSGGLTLIAREGSEATGTDTGVTYGSISTTPPILSDNEQVAFNSFLSGTGVSHSNDSGIWSEGSGGLSLIAREGSLAPDIAGNVYFKNLGGSHPLKNSIGHTQFIGSLTGTGVNVSNDSGLWNNVGGSLTLIARTGSAAPETENGVNFSGFKGHALNNNGQTALTGNLTGTGIDSTNASGIWSAGGGGGLALIARGGDPAPGTGGGVNFRDFLDGPQLNDNGHTAFTARLTGVGVDSTNDGGIWSEGHGNGLALVAREGDAAPGTEPGVDFRIFDDPVLNRNGHTAFWASLDGPGIDNSNAIGIWSEGAGNGLEIVAREGNRAPGTEAGVDFLSFDRPTLNGLGQTAFKATLTGAGVNSSNDFGIWAEDFSGDLRLIVREGDTLDVDDGPGVDLRTVQAIGFISSTGNEDGRARGFNDLGQIAFIATFTDNTAGVFVSNLATIPEPGTFLLGLIASLGLLLSNRR